MSDVLMQWGDFQFTIATVAFEQLTLSSGWRWVQQERLLREPSSQYLGVGSQTISIRGTIYAQLAGNVLGIDALKKLADSAKPQILSAGGNQGKVFGQFVLKDCNEDHTAFFQGGLSRKNAVSLNFESYGEDKSLIPTSGTYKVGGITLDFGLLPEAVFGNTGNAASLIGTIKGLGTNFLSGASVGGLNLGNLAALASPLSSAASLPALLNAVGLKGDISQIATGGLASLGVQASGLMQSFLGGNGGEGMAIALQQMATKFGSQLLKDQLGKIAPGLEGELGKWIGAASQIGSVLGVDPAIAGKLEKLILR